MCDILVIAQFHENLAWIESAASETREMRIVRYTKESGNYGRESASYIRFIAEHYRDTRTANDTLVCFSQGSIRGPQTQMTSLSLPPRKSAPYTPLFNSIRVRFDSCGRPHDRLPCLMHIATSINITTPREANMGAFFRTTMRALRAVPLDVWWHLYHLHFTHTFCRLPWVMERLWEKPAIAASCSQTHELFRRINPNTKQTKQKKQHRVSRRGECKRAGSAGSANGRR